MNLVKNLLTIISAFLLGSLIAIAQAQSNPDTTRVHTGQASFHDWTQERPGERWKTVVADLPAPYVTESEDNGPTMAPRPKDAWPQAPAGFKVELYQDSIFVQPRLIRTAPNSDLFIADSCNRKHRAGYEVIRVPMKNGHATGEYEDFLTGFVNPDGTVWGRPVGVAVDKDGSLFVTDDGSRSVWHVIYTGK